MLSSQADRETSRAATDRLLGHLHRAQWQPQAWARFWRDTLARSIEQARAHPLALAELTAVHLPFAVWGTSRGRVWAAAGWALSALHLGMLEDRSGLGWANLLTLARANLPSLDDRLGVWLPILAVLSDVTDGALARRTDTVTPFGQGADFVADTALWIWFTLRHEPNRSIKAAALIAWGLPIVAVTAASFARGGMIDVPRPRWLRPCATVQAVICARAIRRCVAR